MSKAKAKEVAGPDGMVPVRIPAPLRQRAKVYAATVNRSLQDVAAEAFEEYLKKRGA